MFTPWGGRYSLHCCTLLQLRARLLVGSTSAVFIVMSLPTFRLVSISTKKSHLILY